MWFCSATLVPFRRHIFELMVSGYGRPMQLLMGEIHRFRELTVYVRGGFSAYRQRGYEYGCCEAIVAKICNSSHNFMFSARIGIQICRIKFLQFVDSYG